MEAYNGSAEVKAALMDKLARNVEAGSLRPFTADLYTALVGERNPVSLVQGMYGIPTCIAVAIDVLQDVLLTPHAGAWPVRAFEAIMPGTYLSGVYGPWVERCAELVGSRLRTSQWLERAEAAVYSELEATFLWGDMFGDLACRDEDISDAVIAQMGADLIAALAGAPLR